MSSLPKEINTGVYYGFASIDNGEVHKMVMSIGHNPYFDNKQKSMVSKNFFFTIISGDYLMLFVNFI